MTLRVEGSENIIRDILPSQGIILQTLIYHINLSSGQEPCSFCISPYPPSLADTKHFLVGRVKRVLSTSKAGSLSPF